MSEPVDNTIVPLSSKRLLACMGCGLVKTYEQFLNQGCQNCDSYLHMYQNKDNVEKFTTSTFEGLVALADPKDSWVGRWQRIERFHPGCYCIKLGRIDNEIALGPEQRNFLIRQEEMQRE